MLSGIKGMHGATLHALDGEIGRVDEMLFDDKRWTVRYLVVHTGNWLSGRKALISPMAFGHQEGAKNKLNVSLTRDQIKSSPGVETHLPVSRQWERDYYDYYDWPYYWSGTAMGEWGGYGYPAALRARPFETAEMLEQRAEERAKDRTDAHLRSTKEVTGYGISATDGHLGHIEDFIVDDETWRVRYLAVDTRDWWPGKRVLLPPNWIGEVNWPDRSVRVKATRDQVRNAPEWDRSQPISPDFEARLYDYYARQRPTAEGPIITH